MIFLDANYIIALYVKKHENHQKAKEIFSLIKNKQKIISNLVILEVITVMNVKLKQNQDLLLKVYNELNKDCTVLNDTDYHYKGLEILIKNLNINKERIPLFDSIYMALMKDLGIKEIATFDEHFDNKENIIRIH